MSNVATPTQQAPTLTAQDRCDQCRAQAYIQVTLAPLSTASNFGTLLFCAHHFRAHESELRVRALNIHDETARLYEEV